MKKFFFAFLYVISKSFIILSPNKVFNSLSNLNILLGSSFILSFLISKLCNSKNKFKKSLKLSSWPLKKSKSNISFITLWHKGNLDIAAKCKGVCPSLSFI